MEALARSGIGTLDLFDNDTVCLSNLNRQIIATHQTLGMYKVDAAKERILSINPNAAVFTHKLFFMPDTADQVDFSVFDYVIDAIDTVTGKIELVMRALLPVFRLSPRWELETKKMPVHLKSLTFIKHRSARSLK